MNEIKKRLDKLRVQAQMMQNEIESIQVYYQDRVSMGQGTNKYFGFGHVANEMLEAKNYIQDLRINIAECINEHDRFDGKL